MGTPTVSIKVKGVQGTKALGIRGQALGGLKTKGSAVGAGKLKADCEVVAAKTGLGTKTATGKSIAAAKGVTAAKGAAACTGSGACGTIWTGTGLGLGLGLGLGAWGPVLLLGTLGLVGAGAYLYYRNRQLAEAEELDGAVEDAVFAG